MMMWSKAALTAVSASIFAIFASAPALAVNLDHVNRLLRTKECMGCDLVGADLIGADLRQANLLGADLRGAKLAGADLTRAQLSLSLIHISQGIVR